MRNNPKNVTTLKKIWNNRYQLIISDCIKSSMELPQLGSDMVRLFANSSNHLWGAHTSQRDRWRYIASRFMKTITLYYEIGIVLAWVRRDRAIYMSDSCQFQFRILLHNSQIAKRSSQMLKQNDDYRMQGIYR